MVESRRGAVAWPCGCTPFPLPAHRTGRADFQHPALRLASRQGYRQYGLTILGQAEDAQLPEDRFMAEANSASRLHFVPPCKKTPHGLYHMAVDRPMCLLSGFRSRSSRPSRAGSRSTHPGCPAKAGNGTLADGRARSA